MNLVILTKSSKRGKYCVAGIDVLNGNWVRLITDDAATDGAVSDADLECIDGRIAQVMDEIEIEVESAPDFIQPENMKIVSDAPLKIVGHYNLERVLRIHSVEWERYVFFTRYKTIKPEYIDYPKSLMLIEVRNLIVGLDGRDKAVASFDYAENRYTDIPVTDPETYPIIDSGNVIKTPKAILVVSLGKPYTSAYTDEMVCYKFVAKIFA